MEADRQSGERNSPSFSLSPKKKPRFAVKRMLLLLCAVSLLDVGDHGSPQLPVLCKH